jgi:hypothetical protein
VLVFGFFVCAQTLSNVFVKGTAAAKHGVFPIVKPNLTAWQAAHAVLLPKIATYRATTQGVHVTITPFCDELRVPVLGGKPYSWQYKVLIENTSPNPVQLVGRTWVIGSTSTVRWAQCGLNVDFHSCFASSRTTTEVRRRPSNPFLATEWWA